MGAWTGRCAACTSSSRLAKREAHPATAIAWCGLGTHALTAHSGTTLWKRLSQHRGTASTGSGNPIFRLLVGGALARRGDCPLPPSWGVEFGRGAAARKLGTTSAALKDAEAELEARVSAYIGGLQLL